MVKKFLARFFVVIAAIVATVFLSAGLALLMRWINKPSATSAEGLLLHADELAWNNNWLAATPVYVKAEEAFNRKGDQGHALYAHVSQFAFRMENSDLSSLIAELNHDLPLPSSSAPDVRLRVLEMKAKCEEEYDAGIAIKTFAEVERIALSQNKYYLASRASGEQGILAFELGNLTEASTRVERSYVVAKYLGDAAAHVRYAEMIGVGIAHIGRPKQALRFLDEAIATQKKHPEVALPSVAYSGKIDSLRQLGRFKEALALADQALVFPLKHGFYGQLESLLMTRAEVLSSAGRTNEAIADYKEALGFAKQVRSWRAITNVDTKLASTYERVGELGRALEAIDEAIEANKQIPQEIFSIPGSMAIKARIQAELGRKADAERLYMQGADVLDVLLARVPTPEIERLLLSEVGDLYSGYFELLSNDGRFADAFQVIERSHGRIEAQELEYNHTETPHGPTSQEQHLKELEVNVVNADDQTKRAALVREFYVSRNNSIGQESPMERTDERIASLAELQSHLEPDELLIEYVLATPRSYALAITRSSAVRYVLPTREQIEGESNKYRDTLRKQRIDKQLGQQLFRELLGFTKDFPKARALIVVADGALHLLPFSALIDQSGKYMIETKPISKAPSGTVLNLIRDRVAAPSATRPYLGVAAWTDVGEKKPWVLRAVSAESKLKELPALPESRDEVESIAAILPKPSTMLVGHGATKEEFQSLPLGDYRVLHLAVHGLVDPVFPDRSALVFAPSKLDNRLEARDIRRLHLKADLVTLSACDTAVGPVGAAGVESVESAFIEAGASSVVSTLWELEDRSTSKLMKAFYAHLNHESKADALRDAELELMHAGLGPYYWASYELVGNPAGGVVTPR